MVQSASRRFEPTSRSVTSARRFVEGALGPDRGDHGVLALLVSELASNAVRHAQTQFVVKVSVDSNTRVEVTDGSPLPPRPAARASRRDGGGHGLVLVDRLAAAWGYYPAGAGKTVWVETGPNGG